MKTSKRNLTRRREGAALLEGIIAMCGVGLGLILLAGLHRAAAADLQAMDRARELAWTHALKGCPGDGFNLRDVVVGLAHGDLPIPDAFLPSKESEGRGDKPAGRARIVRIPCNSAPSHQGPEASPEWVQGLFGDSGGGSW